MNNIPSFNEYLNLAKNKTLLNQTPKNTLSQQSVSIPKEIDSFELNEKFEQAKKQNGLIEKIADKIKSATNIGFSSKKIEQSINETKKGTKTVQEVEKEIKNYRRSQENTAQTIGDLLSIGGAALAFFTAYKNLIKAKSILLINKEKTLAGINIFLNGIKNSNIPSIIKNVTTKTDKEKILNIATDKKTINIIAALPAMYVGQIIKENVLKINRIKTKQYKPEFDKETMSKKEIKEIKKTAKKEKKNANFRNGLTGAINGLTLPIVGLLGPIGAPIYAIVNSLSKYFIASREDKGNKSIKSYIENISTSKITNALGALTIAIPLIKKGQFISVYEKNAQNVVKALENAKLNQTTSFNSVYDNLESLLFDNEKIAAIMNLDIDETEKIRLLSEENIFALKFKQIKNDGTRLTKALKENCPQTWTLEEAQKAVEETFGANKYKLKACVGVGTVAQTFVAQDEKGNDVCIKLIHKGINKEKILKDKKAFIAMINSSSKSQNEKKILN